MKTAKNQNWHLFEGEYLRTSWLSKDEADKILARHRSCFPTVDFYILQADSIRNFQKI